LLVKLDCVDQELDVVWIVRQSSKNVTKLPQLPKNNSKKNKTLNLASDFEILKM